jgi:hypothetical protein
MTCMSLGVAFAITLLSKYNTPHILRVWSVTAARVCPPYRSFGRQVLRLRSCIARHNPAPRAECTCGLHGLEE